MQIICNVARFPLAVATPGGVFDKSIYFLIGENRISWQFLGYCNLIFSIYAYNMLPLCLHDLSIQAIAATTTPPPTPPLYPGHVRRKQATKMQGEKCRYLFISLLAFRWQQKRWKLLTNDTCRWLRLRLWLRFHACSASASVCRSSRFYCFCFSLLLRLLVCICCPILLLLLRYIHPNCCCCTNVVNQK